MEKELIELFESVKKAAEAGEEERCVDALNSLKNFPVNYQLLVSTQVGKRLRRLTKHPKKKIQSLASELVEIWKGIIVEETIKNKKNGSLDIMESPKSNNTAVMSQNKVDRANSFKAARKEEIKVIKTEDIKIENNGHNIAPISEIKLNNVKVEKKPTINEVAPPKLTSLVYCKDPIRDKMREILAEALCKVSEEADDESRDEVNACDPYRVAVSVESAMFEKWGKSKPKYRSVMFNVKDPKNPDFRRKILLGHVKPERIVELTPEEMASTERQMQIVKIKERALFECERGGPQKATTDQFRCGRCGKRKCTYYQLQTRSADEPMTTFVTCVNCDNHWKFC